MLRLRKLFDPESDSAQGSFTPPDRLPSRLVNPRFYLRPLRQEDEEAWQALRARNQQWLSPWDSGDPVGREAPPTFSQWVRRLEGSARAGTGVVLAMMEADRMVGELSLGAISYGAVRSGMMGYWIGQDHAGRGLTPLAVSLLADWAFQAEDGPHLHRLEIALLPENDRSRRVAQKAGFTQEGLRRRYMYVAGRWRDHETWALLADDLPEGVERHFCAAPRHA